MKYYIKLNDKSLSITHYVKTITIGNNGIHVTYTCNKEYALSNEYDTILSLIIFLVNEFNEDQFIPIIKDN